MHAGLDALHDAALGLHAKDEQHAGLAGAQRAGDDAARAAESPS